MRLGGERKSGKSDCNREEWQRELITKEARLQWDPDHDPHGNKLIRRAIQLGLKGNTLENFGKHQIKRIEDITDFVRAQKAFVNDNRLDKLLIPIENIYLPASMEIRAKLGVD